jgi:lipoprotein-anchoring transpeptidase ErfK/SrfK
MKGIPSGAFDSNKNYVEVSISDQKMWLYRNGQVIAESNVVTGCPRRGHATPPGAYYVKYKGRNVVLDGPGYSSRVSWWMPFNKGVGLHDARWRRKFGGEIYLADGSHGCINLPAVTAQLIYDYIQPGSIVICY